MTRDTVDLRSWLLASPKPIIICIGHTAYDLTWEVEQLPQGGGKMPATGFHQGGGGMAANAAAVAAILGADSHFWGRVGDDFAGRTMMEELRTIGVDVSGLRLFAGARSSISGILVDATGERRIVNYRGANLPNDADWLPLHILTGAKAVLGDVRWPAGAGKAFASARAAGVPTVLDGDTAHSHIYSSLLPLVDYAIFSQPGLKDFAPAQTNDEARLRLALTLGCRLAAVTRGAAGTVWTDGGPLHHQPAFRVDVVDTTGAGDAFHGAFAVALGGGVPTAGAFRFAAAVAALKCTRHGGRAGIPNIAGVLAALETLEEI